jgi:hypothetical protein
LLLFFTLVLVEAHQAQPQATIKLGYPLETTDSYASIQIHLLFLQRITALH